MSDEQDNSRAGGSGSKKIIMVAAVAVVIVLVAAVFLIGQGGEGNQPKGLVTGAADMSVMLGPDGMGQEWDLNYNSTYISMGPEPPTGCKD